jgi:hypothetical protein
MAASLASWIRGNDDVRHRCFDVFAWSTRTNYCCVPPLGAVVARCAVARGPGDRLLAMLRVACALAAFGAARVAYLAGGAKGRIQ